MVICGPTAINGCHLGLIRLEILIDRRPIALKNSELEREIVRTEDREVGGVFSDQSVDHGFSNVYFRPSACCILSWQLYTLASVCIFIWSKICKLWSMHRCVEFQECGEPRLRDVLIALKRQ